MANANDTIQATAVVFTGEGESEYEQWSTTHCQRFVEATHLQQMWYWAVSAVICSVSLFAVYWFLLRSCWTRGLGRLMHGPAFRTFYPMLIGDFLFVLTYFPSHVYNFISELPGVGNQHDGPKILDAPLGEAGHFAALCYLQPLGALTSVHVQFAGILLVAYSPYKIMVDTVNHRRAYGISKQWVWLAVGGAFFVSALHISILLAEQRVGSYRQLYCGACNWQRVETGGWMLIEFGIVVVGVVFFYTRAWHMVGVAEGRVNVRSHKKGRRAQQDLALHSAHSHAVSKQAWHIVRTGMMTLAGLSLTWGLFYIITILNVGGAPMPIYLDMASGWMAKMKPLIDVLIIQQLPVMVHIRNKADTLREDWRRERMDEVQRVSEHGAVRRHSQDGHSQQLSQLLVAHASNSSFAGRASTRSLYTIQRLSQGLMHSMDTLLHHQAPTSLSRDHPDSGPPAMLEKRHQRGGPAPAVPATPPEMPGDYISASPMQSSPPADAEGEASPVFLPSGSSSSSHRRRHQTPPPPLPEMRYTLPLPEIPPPEPSGPEAPGVVRYAGGRVHWITLRSYARVAPVVRLLQHERSGVGLACTSTRASGHADFTALPHVSVDQHSAVDDHGSRVLLYEGSEDEDRDADSSESSEDGETDDDDEDEDDIEKIKSEAQTRRRTRDRELRESAPETRTEQVPRLATTPEVRALFTTDPVVKVSTACQPSSSSEEDEEEQELVRRHSASGSVVSRV